MLKLTEYELNLKLQAFLHDPPEKAGVLFHGVSHEEIAGELRSMIGLPDVVDKRIEEADHIASAADRLQLPHDGNFRADFRKEPILHHPLSGKELNLQTLADIDWNHITEAVQREFRYITETYGTDKKKIYLSLWRELPELLASADDGMGFLWYYLPADTRIPDHSIWDHLKLTAAFATALPDPALFLWSVGPVQSFIASARKTNDLRAGSYILSYLASRAILTILETCGPDAIIFPDLWGQPLIDDYLTAAGLRLSSKMRKGKDGRLISPSLPNRVLAVVPQGKVGELGKACEQAVRSEFKRLMEKAASPAIAHASDAGQYIQQQLERQGILALDIQFSAQTWSGDPDEFVDKVVPQFLQRDSNSNFRKFWKEIKAKQGQFWDPNRGTIYGEVYHLLERQMGAVKLGRVLPSLKFVEEPGHKCTLCGQREPLSEPPTNGLHDAHLLWGKIRQSSNALANEGEALCAICFTKRNLPDKPRVPSTANIAAASFLSQLAHAAQTDKKIRDTACVFAEKAKKLEEMVGPGYVPKKLYMELKEASLELLADVEGRLLYLDEYDNLAREFPNHKHDIDIVRCSLKKLFDECKEPGILGPLKYYAIIVADGDSMGEWLSGEKGPKLSEVFHPTIRDELQKIYKTFLDLKRPLSPAIHQSLSRALRDFSLDVVPYIIEERYAGFLVYAGGDDLLAFSPLRDLPSLLNEISQSYPGSSDMVFDFQHVLSSKGFAAANGFAACQGKLYRVMGETASISAGIAVAHYKTPLSVALAEARRMEEHAKDLPGKRAFAISLMKRSGGTEIFQSYWREDKIEPLLLLSKWSRLFGSEGRNDCGSLSTRFLHEAREVLPTLAAADSSLQTLSKELHRLFSRHLAPPESLKTREQQEDWCREFLSKFGNNLLNLTVDLAHTFFLSSDATSSDRAEHLCRFLSIAEFFARGARN